MAKFNEQKLRRLIADAEEMLAASRQAQDRFIDAKADLEQFEMDEKYRAQRYYKYVSDENAEARLERLREELAYRLELRDLAGEKFRLAKVIADRCENYARDVLGWSPEPPGTITGVGVSISGGNFERGA